MVVYKGVGNADQSWYGAGKRLMDKKSQSLGPRLKFQLPHVLLYSNIGAQILLSRAVGVVIHGLVAVPMAWLLEMGSNTG